MALTVAREIRSMSAERLFFRQEGENEGQDREPEEGEGREKHDVLDTVHHQLKETTHHPEAGLFVPGQVQSEHIAGSDEAVELEDEDSVAGHAEDVHGHRAKDLKAGVQAQSVGEDDGNVVRVHYWWARPS